uniref:ATP synthase complex subunit 8 n=1 Tax=Coleoptera sp. 5 KM-2017 TaxID=2219339 RepID=A0A346RFW2_9COLE|nr:ATP synthase F0 subunit 8 [Coleoptera sp. 5 KM-2017]
MPQMAPLNWILLSLLFIFLFIMMIILNYYIFLYTPINMTKIPLISSKSWKW